MIFNMASSARKGMIKTVRVTLAAATVLRVNLPNESRGFRLRPQAEIKFAVGADPVATPVDVGTGTLADTIFVNGGIAESGKWEVWLLKEMGDNEFVALLAATGTTCDIEVF